MKKQSFLYGAAVLAAASIICKMLSAVLKIPLDRLFLHEEGIGIYQSAYSIYNVFLAICVTGIPVALSSLIAVSDEKRAASLVKSTFVAVSVFGIVSGALLLIFQEPLARVLSGGVEAVAAPSVAMLAPALFVMGFISSRKGYFQGMGNMTPSAMGQIGESIAKVILGIGICALTIKWGISYGAAGAISGVTAGAFIQAAVLEIAYRKTRKEKGEFSSGLVLDVVKISVPMTLGAFGLTAVMLLDTLSVPKLLASNGIVIAERLKLLGYLTRANTVYNLPATVISAFTASAVPALAFAKKGSDSALLSENAVKVIKLVFLAALPCGVGMMLFHKEILALIYSSESHSILLMFTGLMVLIMPYIQTTTAMLQTLGKVWTPIWVSIGAIVVKAVLNCVLVKAFGIEGAPFATVISFLPVAVINTVLLNKIAPLRGAIRIFSKISACAIISCGLAKLICLLSGGAFLFLLSMAFAGVFYIVLTVITKCITKEEFRKG